ncbi:MAG TPA: universal stress protein, partial [Dehalococcoidales bacterium]|nr:universal stress protein [Dehalococcoidales bacterium]
MYRRMLVVLDGSKLAEETIPYACQMAGRLDINVDLLHVTSPLASKALPFMIQFYMDKMAESIKEQILKIQTTITNKKALKPVEVKSKVVTGHPVEEILKYTQENTIDLIMIATHGASGIRRWAALGSVANQVLHAAEVPVLLIRSGMSPTPIDGRLAHTILVPLDNSKVAEAALPYAEELAKQRGVQSVEILLVNVCEPYIIPEE